LLKERRIKQIHEYLIKNQSVSLDELVRVFHVSKNTIRRDVQELVERGDFKKVYGGVTINQKNLESFHDRQIKNQHEKVIIGKLAARFVDEEDIIFLDSGTTTIEMFNYIKDKRLTVLTNNLEFIERSIPYNNLNVISTGGILERKTNSLSNYNNLNLLKNYNINKAFMAATGISITNGVTNASPYETKLKHTIVEKCNKIYLLVDHNKFESCGLMTYCQLNDIDFIITNKTPQKEYLEYFTENEIQLIVGQNPM
jgi:DeoR family myo-inositol catabolism operon transcriptional repressor